MERLISVAIQRSGEIFHANGMIRSHWKLRAVLDPKSDPLNQVPGDIEGFWTSAKRFVTRDEAKNIALQAGQIHASWKDVIRPLLSSDINWG